MSAQTMSQVARELAAWMRMVAGSSEYRQGWSDAAGLAQSFAAACDSPEQLASLLSDWSAMLAAETVSVDPWTQGRRDAARSAANFVAGWVEGSAEAASWLPRRI